MTLGDALRQGWPDLVIGVLVGLAVAGLVAAVTIGFVP